MPDSRQRPGDHKYACPALMIGYGCNTAEWKAHLIRPFARKYYLSQNVSWMGLTRV